MTAFIENIISKKKQILKVILTIVVTMPLAVGISFFGKHKRYDYGNESNKWNNSEKKDTAFPML